MKEIPLGNGQNANATLRSSASGFRSRSLLCEATQSRVGGVSLLRSTRVDDEDYEWLSGYSWYAYYDPR